MDGDKTVTTPAQAAHDGAMQRHRNGAINRAKPIPEYAGKVLGPWKVPAPEQGPGQYRYSESPVMTAQERRELDPPPTAERRQAEPWNYPTQEAEITDAKAARQAARSQGRAETGQAIERGSENTR
jgi:hypothetical protein